MFGHQDDNGTVNNSFLNDSPAPGWGNSAADPTPPAPALPASDQPVAAPAPQSALDAPSTDMPAPASPSPASDDLMDLKHQALQQLSPLVGQLDQSPEEKFRTTMMMIQASDNQALLKDAFAAAQSISDDKQRAQALLDVINEINYFTQQSSGN